MKVQVITDSTSDIPPGMDEDQYRNWLSADLIKSSLTMTRKLGVKPRFFAIPYGEYSLQLIEEAKKVGYEAILTQDPGSVSIDSDLFLLPREPILGNDWSTMKHFEEVLKRVDLPARDFRPSFGRSSVIPSLFGATILEPDLYEPASFRIYVSELGWQKATMQGDFAVVTNSSTLNRRINRVAISGREKESGRTAIRYWMLVKEIEN